MSKDDVVQIDVVIKYKGRNKGGTLMIAKDQQSLKKIYDLTISMATSMRTGVYSFLWPDQYGIKESQ
ncbi:MAG TPA: hypothetical protein ENG83_08545 [Nitrospirae bacterium]|nr:hypothetical protein [Nitrospirota bacterium]HDZ03064.1 hypothetical protein [Nitrospirota bacterium]